MGDGTLADVLAGQSSRAGRLADLSGHPVNPNEPTEETDDDRK
jgi:hypothetical protein